MAGKKPGRGSDQFPLRLPDGMRDRIKDAADKNGRSMNAEIVAALEEAYPERSTFHEELSFMDEIEAIQERLERIKAARIAEVSQNTIGELDQKLKGSIKKQDE
ncbi:Arc family DNA-binding protein [Rhizobium leguminosarum bv. trifolii]|uniref:Arc family DNA-binding protein n=1 Tax=Rhizobium ruizarguesonis TaxID=2081791 RepID=UPI0013DCEBCD|nr:Arc family DNA-binding protein [Rhizobium ruizarguesonis]NEH85293.1 Arc family DNA-binding protein [Rhizobium ruizarguesonis]QIO45055.1 Arc family DNA-binding protein [Rhizobium leguminosarum bv. trifolii]